MKRQIIFINYSPIEEKINYSHKEYCSNAIVEKDGKYFIIYYTTKTIEYSKAIEAEINSTLVANVNKYILSSFRKNDSDEMKLLMSTPFKANGEYDANLIISEPEKFIWTCVVFADFIEKKIIEYQIGSSLLQLKLLSVSLRSSPFAAAVAMLLNMNLMTIEHLGPVRKYFYTNSIMRTEHFEYLYIGDFSFAGTEIRMSKMYSALGGSVLNHVFVLGSLFNNERFEDFTLHALSDLNAINNSAQYALF
jgi:hypothetical protein